MNAELHFVGIPDFVLILAFPRGAGFVVNGSDFAFGEQIAGLSDGGSVADFDQIHFGDYAELFGAERDAAGVNGFWFGVVVAVGGGQGAFAGVHSLVEGAAAPCVGVVEKHAFHILVVEQPRAVDELVQHAGGERLGGVRRGDLEAVFGEFGG